MDYTPEQLERLRRSAISRYNTAAHQYQTACREARHLETSNPAAFEAYVSRFRDQMDACAQAFMNLGGNDPRGLTR